MAWFRRKGEQDAQVDAAAEAADDLDEGSATSADEADDDVVDPEAEAAREKAEDDRRELGPFDATEVDDADGVQRIDLGSLRLQGRDGMELRLEVEDKTQRVIAVTVALGGSTLQMQAFAAPRTLGVWDGIREEIAAQVTKQGGSADEVPGVFGRELIARIPVRTADGRTGHQASRFVGVDGPRWFLRGVFGGPASHDHDAAAPLEDVLRTTVVVRGSEAMAPRDLLPLTLPAQARPLAEVEAEAARPERTEDDLAPFDRGPEITETR